MLGLRWGAGLAEGASVRLQVPARSHPPKRTAATAASPDPAAAVDTVPHPPEIAATTVTSSPSLTGVANPLWNRMSSSFR